jgi:hypothetical protein
VKGHFFFCWKHTLLCFSDINFPPRVIFKWNYKKSLRWWEVNKIPRRQQAIPWKIWLMNMNIVPKIVEMSHNKCIKWFNYTLLNVCRCTGTIHGCLVANLAVFGDDFRRSLMSLYNCKGRYSKKAPWLAGPALSRRTTLPGLPLGTAEYVPWRILKMC